MNLILHQFKTDARHFRWRLCVLWLAFALSPVVNNFHSLTDEGMGVSVTLLLLWQVFFALGIVIALIQADPLVGASAAWLARPMRRAHLFWAKSVFILLFIFLPWLATLVIDWSVRGYSPGLELMAAAEVLLYAVPIVLVMAVLAALTRNAARFFLALGLVIGAFFAWTVFVDTMVHWGVLRQADMIGPQTVQLKSCALTIALLVLAAGGLAAWLWQARAARGRTAVVCLALGLLAFPVIATVWNKNFLTPRLTPSAPVSLSLFDTNRPVASSGQWLSIELLLSGVPARQVAVIQDFSAYARFAGTHGATTIPYPYSTAYQNRIRPWGSMAEGDYYHIIQDFFPPETLWFDDNYYNGHGSVFKLDDLYKKFNSHLPPADLSGQATVDLYQVQKVADLPLQPATCLALPGLRVNIQRVVQADDVINIMLDESSARLIFDRNVDPARPQNNYNDGAFCTYVLYHPGSGEAYVVEQRNAQMGFPGLLGSEAHTSIRLDFPYPALRERFAGVTAAEWLREARLCIFAPVYAGTSRLAFGQRDYHWPEESPGRYRQQKQTDAGNQAISQAVLPPDFTSAQLDAYLAEIFSNLPPLYHDATGKVAIKKLAAIGTNGLPTLLQRLPLAYNVESLYVFPAISRVITRDQLPELRAAFQRDDNVIDLFLKKHWEADVRDLLLARLSVHRQPLPAEALRLAAEMKDPATYANLRWQFVHLESGHDLVIPALEQCPGFDTAAAVREAWQFARLGVTSPDDLATAAARQNLPDALNLAVVLAGHTPVEQTQDRLLSQLATLTSYTGPTNETLPWLTANVSRLKYDPAQQRYTLEH